MYAIEFIQGQVIVVLALLVIKLTLEITGRFDD